MKKETQYRSLELETEPNPKNTELIEKREIENTPFTAVRVNDKWFLGCANFRLTEPMNSYEEVLESTKLSWHLVTQLISIMIEHQPKNYLNNNQNN